MRLISLLTVAVLVSLNPAFADPRPSSILVLDQSGPGLPWYTAINSTFRASLNRSSQGPIAIYAENLDLNRFREASYEGALKTYFREKYRARPVGVIVAVGVLALNFVLRARLEIESWSQVPVIFTAVDHGSVANRKLPLDVAGRTINITPETLVETTRMLFPETKSIALVGGTSLRSIFLAPTEGASEPEQAPSGFNLIDLSEASRLPMAEIRSRVANLPEKTVIFFRGVSLDGAGVTYIPADSLALIKEAANSPMLANTESWVGQGVVGGMVAAAAPIGESAADLALRVLRGEPPSSISVGPGDFVRPVFDWRELKRWNVDESVLPPGSEVRFRRLSVWDTYRWQILAILTAIIIQALMICWLLFERSRRRIAEMEVRERLAEVIHLNRTATVGALSASFAHELNQPLGSIQSYAEAAELYLKADPPNIPEVQRILADILQDDQRAAAIVSHVSGLLKRRNAAEMQTFDLSEAVRSVSRTLASEAQRRGVELFIDNATCPLPVRVEKVHLEQVLFNLAMNGMDAMQSCTPGRAKMSIQAALAGVSTIRVSIADTGTGIAGDKLNQIFEAFYTTKQQGTGLGLALARTIVGTYGGRIWAENRNEGGAVFHFTLPLATEVSL